MNLAAEAFEVMEVVELPVRRAIACALKEHADMFAQLMHVASPRGLTPDSTLMSKLFDVGIGRDPAASVSVDPRTCSEPLRAATWHAYVCMARPEESDAAGQRRRKRRKHAMSVHEQRERSQLHAMHAVHLALQHDR